MCSKQNKQKIQAYIARTTTQGKDRLVSLEQIQIDNDSSIHVARFSGYAVEYTASSADKAWPFKPVMMFGWLSEPENLTKQVGI